MIRLFHLSPPIAPEQSISLEIVEDMRKEALKAIKASAPGGDPEFAFTHYTNVKKKFSLLTQSNAPSAEAYYYRALTESAIGGDLVFQASTIDHCTQAINLKRGYVESHVLRANLIERKQLQSLKLSESDCELIKHDRDEAIRLSPDHPNYYEDRLKFRFRSKDYRGTIEDCKAIERLDPFIYAKNIEYHLAAYFHLNDWYHALNLWQIYSDSFSSIESHANHSFSSLETEFRLKEEPWWDQKIAEAKQNLEIELKNKNRQKKYSELIRDCDLLLNFDPENKSAFYYRATAQYCLKKYDDSILDCNEYIRLEPEDFRGYYKRALAYSQIEYYKSAIKNFELALQLYPENIDCLKGLQRIRKILVKIEEELAEKNKQNEIFSNYLKKLRTDTSYLNFSISILNSRWNDPVLEKQAEKLQRFDFFAYRGHFYFEMAEEAIMKKTKRVLYANAFYDYQKMIDRNLFLDKVNERIQIIETFMIAMPLTAKIPKGAIVPLDIPLGQQPLTEQQIAELERGPS